MKNGLEAAPLHYLACYVLVQMKINLRAKNMLGNVLCDNWRLYESILFLVSDMLREQGAGCELILQTEFFAPTEHADHIKLTTVKTVTYQCCSPSRNWMVKYSNKKANYELTPKGQALIQPLLDGKTINYTCHEHNVNLFNPSTLKKINDLVGELTNQEAHELLKKIRAAAADVLRKQEAVPYYGFSPGYKVVQS